MVADLVTWVHDSGSNGGDGEGGGGGGDRCVHVMKFPQSFRGTDIDWRHKSKTVLGHRQGDGPEGHLAIGHWVLCLRGTADPTAGTVKAEAEVVIDACP